LIEPSREPRDGLIPGQNGWDDHDRWQIRINPHHHHPETIPPKRVDPERQPRLHPRAKLKLTPTHGPDPPPPDP
ncbi:MAG: hypothetical protein LBD77_05320, partial [Bifidobacteriaceae bacterium]|nr:hypothetical protein [Bifidobacteriaceae bacterium]